MVGLFSGIVTGIERYLSKKTDPPKEVVRTAVSLGPGCEIFIPGNSLKVGQAVFVAGDVRRTNEGRFYVDEGARVVKRPIELDLDQVCAQIERGMASRPAAVGATG
jgi:hypothetical protein